MTFGKIVHALFLVNAILSKSEFFKRSEMSYHVSYMKGNKYSVNLQCILNREPQHSTKSEILEDINFLSFFLIVTTKYYFSLM